MSSLTMAYQKFSANTIHGVDSLTFDKDKYSRFKYGSKAVAREFGSELGLKLFNSDIPRADMQIVLIPSPYTFVPSAAKALTDYTISTFNPLLIKIGLRPVQEAKIYRHRWYTQEYGNLSKEERMRLIQDDTFQCDDEFLQNKYLIFIDDIKITGTHQMKIETMIERKGLNPDNCLFVYYAELVNDSIDPAIEDYLNKYSVKTLLDIDRIIKNEEFIFNTRVIKHILRSPREEARSFLDYQSEQFRETLHYWAIGESYHLEPSFRENFEYLELLIENKK